MIGRHLSKNHLIEHFEFETSSSPHLLGGSATQDCSGKFLIRKASLLLGMVSHHIGGKVRIGYPERDLPDEEAHLMANKRGSAFNTLRMWPIGILKHTGLDVWKYA